VIGWNAVDLCQYEAKTPPTPNTLHDRQEIETVRENIAISGG
jgi:hypothetical protein